MRPKKIFKIKLHNLDRFIKENSDDFSLSGSDPPESLLSRVGSDEDENFRLQNEFEPENTFFDRLQKKFKSEVNKSSRLCLS